MNLEELANKYATDKRGEDHNYVKYYEKYFKSVRESAEHVFEIGIFESKDKQNRPYGAASLKLWEDYFAKATIYGADVVDFRKHSTERTKISQLDQANRDHLKAFADHCGVEFDIIIDDGGHTMKQQQISFDFLFNYLKSGGIYVIEDLHTSYGNLFPHYSKEGGSSTLALLQDYQSSGELESEFFENAEINAQNIQELHIEQGRMSPIAFIIKK